MSAFSTKINEAGIPLISGLFNNDNENALQDAIANMGQAYQQYRGSMAHARGNQFAGQLASYAPVQQFLGQMIPGIQQPDTALMQKQFQDSTAYLQGMRPVAEQQAPAHQQQQAQDLAKRAAQLVADGHAEEARRLLSSGGLTSGQGPAAAVGAR